MELCIVYHVDYNIQNKKVVEKNSNLMTFFLFAQLSRAVL